MIQLVAVFLLGFSILFLITWAMPTEVGFMWFIVVAIATSVYLRLKSGGL